MLERMLTQPELLELVDELALKRRIIGPVAREGRFFYEVVTRAAELDLAFNYCVYATRAFLFPPVETLFTFNKHENNFAAEPIIDANAMAFVGVHPCDIHAIRLLDHVFEQDHRDEHYLARRAHTMIVGIDCPRPCTEGVFCADMHANTAEDGFDVMLYPLHDAGTPKVVYGVLFGTTAGKEWLLYGRRGHVPTAEDERAFEQYQREKFAAFPRMLRTPADELPVLLDHSYDSLLWEATARRCYSCGSCNLSCPTCYCFNILDETDLSGTMGRRDRTWDGCHLKGFAEVAGGHNFRPKAASRLRHRIYRKAKWIRQRTGLPGCVGCARCDRACTAKINSVEIYNQLAEEV